MEDSSHESDITRLFTSIEAKSKEHPAFKETFKLAKNGMITYFQSIFELSLLDTLKVNLAAFETKLAASKNKPSLIPEFFNLIK